MIANNGNGKLSLLREYTKVSSWPVALLALITVGMGYISTMNYFLFSELIELATIIIGFSLFLIIFSNYRHLTNQAIPILGIACAFTGIFNFLQVLAYKYSGIFINEDFNLAMQLDVIAKYQYAIGLFIVGISFYKSIKMCYVFIIYGIISITSLLGIFYWQVFPACYVEGLGYTNFKIDSEDTVCLILILSLALLIRNKTYFSFKVFQLLIFFYSASIGTEFIMIIYHNMFAVRTIFANWLKLIAYIFFYCGIEISIKESYEKLCNVSMYLDMMTDAFYILDNKWCFIYINSIAKKYLFRNKETILGKCLWDIYPKNQFFYDQYQRAKTENIAVCFEAQAGIHNSWVEVQAYPFKQGLFICFHDIADRKALERQVGEYNELIHEQVRLLEIDPDSLIICDLDGKITFWNRASEKMYGFSKMEAMGKFEQDLLKSSFPIPLQEIQIELLKNGTWSGEILQNGKVDKQMIVNSCWLLRRNSLGVLSSILKINKDLTQEKRIQQELAGLDQMKLVSQIAAGISHEIRNPMTTVRGYLQLLSLKNELNSYQPKFELMIEEIDRANHIITEFLALAKNKTESLTLQDLNHVIFDLSPLLESDASSCGKHFNAHLFQNSIPLLLDKSEIRQLILNLVRNSLEAVDTDGRVTITTFSDQEEGVLVVKDNGSGIPNEIMDKLGTPFISTKETGTGLGLSICYSIAKHHNAKIDIETGDQGTTFYIKFPLYKEGLI